MAAIAFLLLPACGGSPSYETDTAPAPMADAARLGERIFSDTSLSASRAQSCATCHVASRGHAPDNTLAAQLGGANLTT